MAISNTSILIKRSGLGGLGRPSALLAGELAYSYQSNTIFIGSPTGNGVVNVGGQYYTSQIDAASSANTASALIKRDANGAFYGRHYGVSNTAVALDTAQNFSITGDVLASAISFNGTGAVALSSALNNINPNTGTFGSTTAIPVISVGANGRITGVTTSPISTSFTINDGTTSNTINGGSTFYHIGNKGIVTAVSANTVTFSTDNTVVRSNTSVATQVISSNVTISQDLTVSGNLYIMGNATTINTSSFAVQDSMIVLGIGNYTTDVLDIGFAGHYNNGTNAHSGLIRDSGTKEWYVFQGYTPELSANNNIDINDPSFSTANLNASYVKGNLVATSASIGTLSLTNALTVPNGGTGKTTFTSGQLLVGSGVNGLTQIANSSVAAGQTFGTAAVVPVFTTDVWGRVATISNTNIAIDTSAVTSGTLPIARGGSNASSYAQNGLLYFNGTSFLTTANVTAYTGQGGASYVPVISTNALGQVSSISNTQIQIDAVTNIVSGTLPVTRGGTGLATVTTNGIVYGSGTGTLGVTAVAGTADQTFSNQILTVTNSGTPIWSTSMDGGTF